MIIYYVIWNVLMYACKWSVFMCEPGKTHYNPRTRDVELLVQTLAIQTEPYSHFVDPLANLDLRWGLKWFSECVAKDLKIQVNKWKDVPIAA